MSATLIRAGFAPGFARVTVRDAGRPPASTVPKFRDRGDMDLAPATTTGPNGETATLHYDSHGRVDSSTSPHGAQTTYAYDNANGTVTATTHGASGDRWTRTTLDGFSRAVKVEKGNGTTTVPTTETIYGPCACSPLGKVAQVSQPYAPGGTKYYTTHSYDGVGRTSSVQLPDGASHTQYTYQGNVITVTDPAGHGSSTPGTPLATCGRCWNRTPRPTPCPVRPIRRRPIRCPARPPAPS